MTVTFISETELMGLATSSLAGLGLESQDACDAARILVYADMFGIHTHGVERILSYAERLKIGGINARATITSTPLTPSILSIDGDNGLGPLVGARALEAAMLAARKDGLALALVKASNHFGPICPYSYIAAENGFATLIGSNATTTIAPWGGNEAKLGNNPFGFGIPNPGGDPIMLDMAMSVAARAKIRSAAKEGQPIPDSWATDRDGNPTTDPAEALKGFLQPVGGHKGYGLALVVDLIAGLLSGAGYLSHVKSWVDTPEEAQNVGHYFLLIDVGRIGSPDWLAERISDFTAILHDTPSIAPDRPVLIPGELEMNCFRRAQEDGMGLHKDTLSALRALLA
ncbi:MAG: Ldh family oxidoreductase [Candidatus Puniceispirillaceae bacterium]